MTKQEKFDNLCKKIIFLEKRIKDYLTHLESFKNEDNFDYTDILNMESDLIEDAANSLKQLTKYYFPQSQTDDYERNLDDIPF